MKRKPTIVLMVLVLIGAAFAFPQEARDSPSFVDELTRLLRSEWSDDEIRLLTESSGALPWPAPVRPTVEAVALSLSYYRGAADVSPAEVARLASELAEVATAMHDTGFRPTEIGRAAVEGTRDALAGRDSTDPAASAELLGATVRDSVLSRIREQIRVVAAGRGPEVAREITNRIGESPGNEPFGGGPPSISPWGPFD